MAKRSNILNLLLIGVVKIYRNMLSPFMPSCCRFYPSCSEYALEALTSHGFLFACKLILFRLLRCHPWYPGGVDLVPKKDSGPNRT